MDDVGAVASGPGPDRVADVLAPVVDAPRCAHAAGAALDQDQLAVGDAVPGLPRSASQAVIVTSGAAAASANDGRPGL